jgi:hypothetical protein
MMAVILVTYLEETNIVMTSSGLPFLEDGDKGKLLSAPTPRFGRCLFQYWGPWRLTR